MVQSMPDVEPDEMASRAHELVFRNLRSESLDAGISNRRFRSTPISLIHITTPPATCIGATCAA